MLGLKKNFFLIIGKNGHFINKNVGDKNKIPVIMNNFLGFFFQNTN